MSLRHPFPSTLLPEFTLKQEPSSAPPVSRKPKEVSFRPGADLTEVAKEICGYKNVRLCAAVGAGKSTDMPVEIAKVSGKTVIHLMPSRLLAVDQYDYLSVKRPATYALALSPADSWAGSMVIHSYYANAVASLLISGIDGKPFGENVILFVDECQESDAYTYIIQKFGPHISGVDAVVYSSATHVADYAPMREPLGEIETRVFPLEKPSTWDPTDNGKPWSISALQGNSMLFVDSDMDAGKLVTKYNCAGFSAYRMTAKMQVSAFRNAMKALRNENGGIVILVADYSFRSGFTMDVQTIVDSSIVRYVVVENGVIGVRYRMAYNLERKQASGRGARTAGSSCVYWVPEKQAEDAICKLDGVEVDAAALMCRFLGYKPFPEIEVMAAMSKGNVPNDFARALNSEIPLQLLDPEQLSPLVKRARSLSVSYDSGDVIDEYTSRTPVVEYQDMFAGVVSADKDVGAVTVASGMGFLQQLREMSGNMSSVIPGVHYTCAGLPNADAISRLYGVDWKQAMLEILKNPSIVVGFQDADRHELIAMLMAEYNRFVAVANGINAMLESKDSLQSLAMRFPSVVKTWSDRVGSELREAESSYSSIARVLDLLRTAALRYVPLDSDPGMVKSVAESYAGMLLGALKRVQSNVDGDGYMKYIQSKVGAVEAFSVDSEAMDVDRVGGRTTIRVKAKPVRVGTKAMQDVTLMSEDSLSWSRNEYKDAVMMYLKTSGLAVQSIRKLKLEGTEVDPNLIMQELRDARGYRHRRMSEYEICVVKKN